MKQILLLCLLLLTACNTPSQTSTPAPLDTPIASSQTASITDTPTATANEPCAFVWAYQDLPEISTNFDKAIKELQPGAKGSAKAYGENCVYADGRADFSAMETDFWVTIHAKDLKNETELGDWIIKVMKVVDTFPPSVVPGPNRGLVNFDFVLGDESLKVSSVSIDKYHTIPPNTSPAEIFRMFKPAP